MMALTGISVAATVKATAAMGVMCDNVTTDAALAVAKPTEMTQKSKFAR